MEETMELGMLLWKVVTKEGTSGSSSHHAMGE